MLLPDLIACNESYYKRVYLSDKVCGYCKFFFILKIGCMIMNKSIIILKLNYVSFYFKNQTNLIFYALCFETHFFQELLHIRELLTGIFWNDYDENQTKNVFSKLNVPEIAGIRKKCASLSY